MGFFSRRAEDAIFERDPRHRNRLDWPLAQLFNRDAGTGQAVFDIVFNRLIKHFAKAETFGQPGKNPVIRFCFAHRFYRFFHQLHVVAANAGHQAEIFKDGGHRQHQVCIQGGGAHQVIGHHHKGHFLQCLLDHIGIG
ncbi:hypothetical protein D3C73_662660 [compost metagenome]